jgi:RNA polymerase sigma-70 factor, ECF subfamily
MEPAAFEEMYRTHYTRLRNAAWSMIGDKDAAHDLVQEVFVKLWSRLGELDHILDQRAYLLRAVMNSSINYVEKKKRTLLIINEREKGPGSSDSAMLYKELEGKVHAAIEKLPPKCKAIFVLSRFEEHSYKEIAAVLGLSLKTVENQMGIALKKLREELKPFISKDIMLAALLGSHIFLQAWASLA